MKLDKVNSLYMALALVIVVAVGITGVSYSRQKAAERKVEMLVNGIQSATSLPDLKVNANGMEAYAGAASSADASKAVGTCSDGTTMYQATHGSDKGTRWCGGGGTFKSGDSDWWNPFSW